MLVLFVYFYFLWKIFFLQIILFVLYFVLKDTEWKAKSKKLQIRFLKSLFLRLYRNKELK